MTIGTECSKCGSTDGIGFMGDVPMCMDCYGVPQVVPPPLQPGDAVWVRAVVCKISGELQDRAYVTMSHADSPVCHYPFEVPLSAIRRIEGEVKP